MSAGILNLCNFIVLQVGELVEDIFEIGFWLAIIVIILIALVIWWIVKKLRGRGRDTRRL